ncbi:cell division protein FtsQ [soil metagenome]
MAAAVKGGRAKAAKPQPRAQKRSARSTAKSAPAYAPSKLGGGRSAGLDPRIAVACAGIALALGAGVFLFTGHRMAAAGKGAGNLVGHQLAGLGLKVATLQLKGASPAARADIMAAAAVNKDDPILSVDLAAMRGRVEKIGWVEEARVVRLLPDTIVIQVKEHAPAAVWQSEGVLRVVDAKGQPIRGADPASFPNLPFLVGKGANEAVAVTGEGADILALVRARPRLEERLEALVRVDERRWDLRLKDGAIVKLPAVGEESALIQLDLLDRNQRVLELGFERIDLRTPEMVVVRRRDATVPGQLMAGGV